MIGPKIWAGMLVTARPAGGHVVTPMVGNAEREMIWGGEYAEIFNDGSDMRVAVKEIDTKFHDLMALSAQLEATATVARADETYTAIDRPRDNWYLHNLEAACYMSIYLTLMINSRTTKITHVKGAPGTAQKSQVAKQGLAHRVVSVVPREYLVHDGEGSSRGPQKLHWRRSHLRHYEKATPHSVWAPDKEHDGRKGWWVCVIPRYLAGKREAGEISHDYWVPPVH